MAKRIELNDAKLEYEEHFNEFEKFEKAVVDQISVLIRENDIKLAVPIQSRIKSFNSVAEKHESGRFNIKKSILELQDLLGVRILILFKRDVEAIVKLIYDYFNVKKEYNTGDKLSADQFGYSSKHFIFGIKDEWLKVPLYKNLGKYTGEIQIRTLSQHHWAETSNVLQYKDKTNVPREIQRSIGRVSALLEMVDLEYERLLNEREKYTEDIKNNYDKIDVLNVETMKLVFDKTFPEKNKTDDEDFSDLFKEISQFGIETPQELETVIVKNIDAVMAKEKEFVESAKIFNARSHLGVFFTFAGLMRSILQEEDFSKYFKIRRKGKRLPLPKS